MLLQASLATLQHSPDLGVLFYALDTPKTKFYERLVCLEARVNYRDLHRADQPQSMSQRIAQAQEQLRESIAPRIRILQRDFECDFDNTREDATPQRRGITSRSVLNDCRHPPKSCLLHALRHLIRRADQLDQQGRRQDVAAYSHEPWKSSLSPLVSVTSIKHLAAQRHTQLVCFAHYINAHAFATVFKCTK